MGKGPRGNGAIKEYQLAQARIAQGSGTEGTGRFVHGIAVSAPLSIDMRLEEYERRFDTRFARSIREMLHVYAAERAAQANILPKKAFREVRDGLRNRFKLGEDDALYLLADAWKAGMRATSFESGTSYLHGFLTRMGAEHVAEKDRFNTVWRLWGMHLRLLRTHFTCAGTSDLKPETLLRALDLWHATDVNVAPCHAMRAVCAADARGIDAEVFASFAREHGADRLDDLTRLVNDGLITQENVWEFQSRPELIRALTHGQLEWLIRAWNGSTDDLLAFARQRKRDLRRQRGPLFVGTRRTPFRHGFAGAIESTFRTLKEEERTKNPFLHELTMHANPCTAKNALPVEYVPSDDAVLGSVFDCPEELRTGIGNRLALSGDALDDQAERVVRAFGSDAAPDRILFALDLAAAWTGEVAPERCVRAAVAAKRARIQDSFAFDLLLQFGPEHLDEAIELIETGRIGTRECNRLLANPSVVAAHRGRMRALLDRYRLTNAPADIRAFVGTYQPSV